MDAVYEKNRELMEYVDVFDTSGASPHFHSQIELLCVTYGKISATVDGTSAILKAGEISLADSYTVHSYAPLPGSVGKVVIVPRSLAAEYAAAHRGSSPACCFTDDKEAFSRAIALIPLIADAAKGENALYLGGLVAALLGAVSGALPYEEKGRGQSQLMREVLSYIYEHGDEPVTLTALAKRFGYTPSHFSRIFNAFIGGGLKEYLGGVRAEKAAALLCSGKSVTDAAMDSGFQSMRTFYRCFKKKYGVAPKDYPGRIGNFGLA